jgi:hypothetical protein
MRDFPAADLREFTRILKGGFDPRSSALIRGE